VSAPDAATGIGSPRATWRHALPRLAGGLLLRWLGVLALLVVLGLSVTRVADTRWPFTAEDQVNRALERGRTATGDTLSLIMSGFGNTSTVVPLCLVAAVVLRLTLHRWREALLVVTVTIGQSVVFLLTTLVIDRARPEVAKLDESPPTSSFPSGHTSAAIALYTSLAVVVHRRVRTAWARRVVVVVLVCLPALVAVGRLYRGMHHPSDVAASLVNAGLLVLLTDRLLRATPLPDDGEVPRHGIPGPRTPTRTPGPATAAAPAAAPDGVSQPTHATGEDHP
jgi:undecaprenyl-diphosphatase